MGQYPHSVLSICAVRACVCMLACLRVKNISSQTSICLTKSWGLWQISYFQPPYGQASLVIQTFKWIDQPINWKHSCTKLLSVKVVSWTPIHVPGLSFSSFKFVIWCFRRRKMIDGSAEKCITCCVLSAPWGTYWTQNTRTCSAVNCATLRDPLQFYCKVKCVLVSSMLSALLLQRTDPHAVYSGSKWHQLLGVSVRLAGGNSGSLL